MKGANEFNFGLWKHKIPMLGNGNKTLFDFYGSIVDVRKHHNMSCVSVFNGVYRQFDNSEEVIFRCNHFKKNPINNHSIQISDIKLLSKHTFTTYTVEESKLFKDWDCCKNDFPYNEYLGLEDPRIFQHLNETFLYYTMNNPLGKYPIRGIGYTNLLDAKKGNQKTTFLQTNIYGKVPKVQKNWGFFSDSKQLRVLYSIDPFILGEITYDEGVPTLHARQKRSYGCFKPGRSVHMSSNVLPITINGKREYFVMINYRPLSNEFGYISGFAFMSGQKPFRLLRISKRKLTTNITANNIVYYHSITVKGSKYLSATQEDTLIFSGGIDDSFVFKSELRVNDLLQIPTLDCFENHFNFDQLKFKLQSEIAAENAQAELERLEAERVSLENAKKLENERIFKTNVNILCTWYSLILIIFFMLYKFGKKQYRKPNTRT
eukprot:NODE_68_length_25399_cov_0.885771.p5 type:complete len:433 gc:universal NODE_68_length_25399_cov_0.885771:23455-24753(+)